MVSSDEGEDDTAEKKQKKSEAVLRAVIMLTLIHAMLTLIHATLTPIHAILTPIHAISTPSNAILTPLRPSRQNGVAQRPLSAPRKKPIWRPTMMNF